MNLSEETRIRAMERQAWLTEIEQLPEHRAAAVEKAIIEKFQDLFDRYPQLTLEEQHFYFDHRVQVCQMRKMQ